ncbi:putative disease resistance protein RGA3 [Salvia splendens]|uniref:putative disease resistance protein RGA3 n=1 Tax=Salvia splendens TaxID=180675 RepID=UPI001C27C658|nr:putative disease resistance protein RGA3 [Salvia splendens]XP_042058397.1 putative disease resistance protein RGA3 [Salvia splendens]
MELEEAAAAASINVAIENVINFVTKIPDTSGLHKDVQTLISRLETVKAFLCDEEAISFLCDEEAIFIDGFKQWLKKLGPVVFDADNVVDGLKYYLSKGTKITIIRAKVAERRINEINEKLESINNEGKNLRLKGSAPNQPQANSSLSDHVFIERDGDVLELADRLITNTTNQRKREFNILAIQGEGGTGKTMLASKLFNHECIKTRFDLRIWVDLDDIYEPDDLLTKILTTFTSDEVESRQDILKRLQPAFTGKTCLLVLDDVWDDDAMWEDFLDSINGVISTVGNAIIITTSDTNTDVFKIMKPFYVHPLKGLTVEECWSIIKTITFGNQSVPSDLENIGTMIAQRCMGLPLVAYLAGGILHGKSQEHWLPMAEKMHSQDEWELIGEILRLSFLNLSTSSEKMCFAYCSIFPKGYKIVKQEIIEVWMAEGMEEMTWSLWERRF